MKKALAEKPTEIVKSKNGKSYAVKANGKVKLIPTKVNSLQDLLNLDLSVVVVEDYKKMTTQFYRFVKDTVKDAMIAPVIKGGYVLYKAYKVWYSVEGVTILDVKNYGQKIEHPFKDLPTAKELFEFIETLGYNKKSFAKKKEKEAIVVSALLQDIKKLVTAKEVPTEITIKKMYGSFMQDKKIDQDVREHFSKLLCLRFPYLLPKEEIDLAKLRKRALLIVAKNKTKPLQVITKLHRFIQNRSFQVFYGKAIRQFKNQEIRGAKFISEVIRLLKDDSVYIEKKRIPAAQFIVKPPFVITDLHSITNTEVSFSNKSGSHTVSKSKFLAYYLVHRNEKLNCSLQKFIEKEFTAEQVLANPTEKDKFKILNYKFLDGAHDEALYQLCLELMSKYTLYNPLKVVYKNQREDLKVGSKVKVFWNDYYTYFTAQVIKLENGITLRYEDGDVLPLFHFNEIL